MLFHKEVKKFKIILLILLFIIPVMMCAVYSRVYADQSTDQVILTALQGIADYSMPGIGVDKKTYLPYDHLRIDDKTGLTLGCGTYSAASKLAAYTVFLLKCYEAEGYYSRIKLPYTFEETGYLKSNYSVEATNKTIALLRLKRLFKTISDYMENDTAPYLGGMLPWLGISRDGKVTRDKDLVPLLDNGLLTWSYAAILGGLEENNDPLVKEVRDQTKKLLDRQNYELFIDHDKKLFFGEINALTGRGNPGYMLKRIWTEDMLSIMWGLFTSSMPEEEKEAIWNNSLCPVIKWKMLNGKTIHAPQGYVTSNHEVIWTLMYVPLAGTDLKDLFYNTQYLQADFALRKKLPGFQSVGYNPIGSYMKMGIPDGAEFPGYVQECNDAITFATAVGIYVDKERGGEWLASLIQGHGLMTRYGPLESVGLPGKADILSADSQYLVASAISGGVQKEVEKYLKGNKVKGSDESYYEFMKRFFNIAYQRILKENSITSIRGSYQPLPRPRVAIYKHETYRLPPQPAEFEILDNLAESGDDRHGSNVHATTDKNKRWEIDKDGMLVGYAIDPKLSKYSRFAWWGTYMGKERPYLAAYTDISVIVPNDDSDQKIMMHLKREDCSLVQPISINTRIQGRVSEDGKWKTYTFPLKHRKRFIQYPLTYIAFSVDDPKKNSAFNPTGAVRIKSLKLFNRNIKDGQVDVNKSIAELQKPPFLNEACVRPEQINGIQPHFLDSGVIGEATEDISREEDGLLYLEFEDVSTNFGTCGIWTFFDDIELSNLNYFIFDIKKGEMEKNPTCMRLEFKRQEQNVERIVFFYDIDLKENVFLKDRWCRIIIKLPPNLRKEKINMIDFVYDNHIDKLSSGSILISSPIFAKNA